jgi:uncharacterized protein YxeA
LEVKKNKKGVIMIYILGVIAIIWISGILIYMPNIDYNNIAGRPRKEI